MLLKITGWEYSQHYAADPLATIVKAVSKVGDILHLLLEPGAELPLLPRL